MIVKRDARDRGCGTFDWLQSWHSFSFGTWYDPNHMGFRALRVINEDIISGGGGFGMHGHKDMEILTVMMDGTLTHTDSMGHHRHVQAGDIQLMRAGRGIRHSEMNASATEPAHLLQIWLTPNQQGLEPSYQERHIPRADKLDRLALLVSPDGADNSLTIAQDARIHTAILTQGQGVQYRLGDGHAGWVQMMRGSMQLGEVALVAGDGAAITDTERLFFQTDATSESEFLLFDLGPGCVS